MRIIAITGATGGIAQEIIKHVPEDDYVIALGRDLKKIKKHIMVNVQIQSTLPLICQAM